MHKIRFLPHNKAIDVEDGENLIRAAMDLGVHINASCGGAGVCGKCRVVIEEGQVDGGISEKLDQNDMAQGYRQACLAQVKSDLTVRVPVDSAIDASVLERQTTSRRIAHIQGIKLEELKDKGLFLPPVEKKYLELPAPAAQDNLADVSRLVGFLKLSHD